MNARVQHVEQQLQRAQANARESTSERVGANEHDGAGGGAIEWLANTNGVAEQDVALERFHLIGRDDAALECTEAGGDAIGDTAFAQQSLDGLRGAFNLAAGLG